MGSVLNLMAFVVFATTLFMRSVDPVIPQIAHGLGVEPATAALLSTAFTLPYALIQPILGALADMLSKTRLMAVCMFVARAFFHCQRVRAQFRNADGPARDRRHRRRRRVPDRARASSPIRCRSRSARSPSAGILFATMSGNLLGASGAGVVGDLIGWRGVFVAHRRHRPDGAGGGHSRLPRHERDRPGASICRPSCRTTAPCFSNPLAKFCFGAVFLEAVFMFGCLSLPRDDAAQRRRHQRLHRRRGDRRLRHRRRALQLHGALAAHPYRRKAADGLGRHGDGGLPGGDRAAAAVAATSSPISWCSASASTCCTAASRSMSRELAPKARASATAGHSTFFFLGQALGPVVYGLGLSQGIGIVPVLLTGSVALIATGWVCALRLAPRLAAPAIGRDALVAAATRPWAGGRSARTRRSACRRADTSSRRCAGISA